MEGDVERWIASTIVDLAMSYVEDVDAEQLMSVYGLKSVFKAYNVLPRYYKEP